MKQIGLVGPVDKRLVAYPLFKVADMLGKVLVVTDDANFRRFSDNYTNEFTIGRSDFLIVNDISQAVIDNFAIKSTNYDTIIYITTNIVIEGNDITVYCHGNSKLICSNDILGELDCVEHVDVTISGSKSAEKTGVSILPDGKNFSYIWNCEENKFFVGCKNAELGKVSAFLFAGVLNMKVEDYVQVLARDE